ncbi:protein kinase domain-containing protein [Sulfidibacter corallicola]|uniref:Protein kinase n=1 Tax=Sulfidibacter corallicola TaxID=2818388 RepID=A0A8A4TUN3_SULCO|nr:protein kinase [Sulfidibacter corallicola]QTD53067.1 protein kinase [Sulfidibacter corallicola]
MAHSHLMTEARLLDELTGNHISARLYPTPAGGVEQLEAIWREKCAPLENAQVNHPTLLKLQGPRRLGQLVGIVSDHGPKVDLGRFLAHQGMVEEEYAIRLVLQISKALVALETQGLIHAQLHPRDILLRSNGEVVLKNYGLYDFDQCVSQELGLSALESPTYLAPEQIGGRVLRPGTSIYQLGLIFFQAVTGALPFKGTLDQIRQGHLNSPPADPRAFNNKLSEGLVRVMSRMLAKRAEDRFTTLSEVQRGLISLLPMGEGLAMMKEAGGPLRKLSDKDAERIESVLDQALTQMEEGDFDGALQVVDSAFRMAGFQENTYEVYQTIWRQRHAVLMRELLNTAQRQLSARQPEEALRTLNKILSVNPREEKAHEMQGNIFLWLAAELPPMSEPTDAALLGLCAERTDNAGLADHCYTKLLLTEPADAGTDGDQLDTLQGLAQSRLEQLRANLGPVAAPVDEEQVLKPGEAIFDADDDDLFDQALDQQLEARLRDTGGPTRFDERFPREDEPAHAPAVEEPTAPVERAVPESEPVAQAPAPEPVAQAPAPEPAPDPPADNYLGYDDEDYETNLVSAPSPLPPTPAEEEPNYLGYDEDDMVAAVPPPPKPAPPPSEPSPADSLDGLDDINADDLGDSLDDSLDDAIGDIDDDAFEEPAAFSPSPAAALEDEDDDLEIPSLEDDVPELPTSLPVPGAAQAQDSGSQGDFARPAASSFDDLLGSPDAEAPVEEPPAEPAPAPAPKVKKPLPVKLLAAVAAVFLVVLVVGGIVMNNASAHRKAAEAAYTKADGLQRDGNWEAALAAWQAAATEFPDYKDTPQRLQGIEADISARDDQLKKYLQRATAYIEEGVLTGNMGDNAMALLKKAEDIAPPNDPQIKAVYDLLNQTESSKVLALLDAGKVPEAKERYDDLKVMIPGFQDPDIEGRIQEWVEKDLLAPGLIKLDRAIAAKNWERAMEITGDMREVVPNSRSVQERWDVVVAEYAARLREAEEKDQKSQMLRYLDVLVTIRPDDEALAERRNELSRTLNQDRIRGLEQSIQDSIEKGKLGQATLVAQRLRKLDSSNEVARQALVQYRREMDRMLDESKKDNARAGLDIYEDILKVLNWRSYRNLQKELQKRVNAFDGRVAGIKRSSLSYDKVIPAIDRIMGEYPDFRKDRNYKWLSDAKTRYERESKAFDTLLGWEREARSNSGITYRQIIERLTKDTYQLNYAKSRISELTNRYRELERNYSGGVTIVIRSATNLPREKSGLNKDPEGFVELTVGRDQKFTTPAINNNRNPKWDFTCNFIAKPGEALTFNVYDKEGRGRELIGQVSLDRLPPSQKGLQLKHADGWVLNLDIRRER